MRAWGGCRQEAAGAAAVAPVDDEDDEPPVDDAVGAALLDEPVEVVDEPVDELESDELDEDLSDEAAGTDDVFAPERASLR